MVSFLLTGSGGVKALKNYLQYAEHGIIDMATISNREPDSDFEISVASAIRQHEYHVDYQVGIAGFFIDLGIVDPQNPGRYLLGIECDGAPYHSARWARDRDRLREQVLNLRGWRIHRIWSTDWYRNPNRQIERVLTAIKEAEDDLHKRGKGENGKGQVVVTTEHQLETSTEKKVYEVPREKISFPRGATALSVEKYKIANITVQLGNSEIHQVPNYRLAKWISEVVNIESPVHFDEICRQITSSANVKRVGARIRSAMWRAVKYAEAERMIKKSDQFLWRPDMQVAPVRDRSNMSQSSKNMKLISPEEIQEAIHIVVKTSLGAKEEEISKQVSILFGFGALKKEAKKLIDLQIEQMKTNGKLICKGDFLVIESE